MWQQTRDSSTLRGQEQTSLLEEVSTTSLQQTRLGQWEQSFWSFLWMTNHLFLETCRTAQTFDAQVAQMVKISARLLLTSDVGDLEKVGRVFDSCNLFWCFKSCRVMCLLVMFLAESSMCMFALTPDFLCLTKLLFPSTRVLHLFLNVGTLTQQTLAQHCLWTKREVFIQRRVVLTNSKLTELLILVEENQFNIFFLQKLCSSTVLGHVASWLIHPFRCLKTFIWEEPFLKGAVIISNFCSTRCQKQCLILALTNKEAIASSEALIS